jgi:hypothetical protein
MIRFLSFIVDLSAIRVTPAPACHSSAVIGAEGCRSVRPSGSQQGEIADLAGHGYLGTEQGAGTDVAAGEWICRNDLIDMPFDFPWRI